MAEETTVQRTDYGKKFFVKKEEITAFVLELFTKHQNDLDTPEEHARIEALLNVSKEQIMNVPKIVANAFDYMFDNDKAMLFKLISNDQTNLVRHIRDTNPIILEWLYNNLPVVILPEKCICGATPVVTQENGADIYNCPNTDCLVNKCNVSATLEKWNELMLGTKGKKKDPEPEIPAEVAQPESLTDILGEI